MKIIESVRVPEGQECMMPECEKRAEVAVGYDKKRYLYVCNNCSNLLIKRSGNETNKNSSEENQIQ